MKVLVVSGSRADYGLLDPVAKALEVPIHKWWGLSFEQAFTEAQSQLEMVRPDVLVILGDRYEMLAVATAAHLLRVPIAHIGGGDVTEGSYDDAMRDAISRMASLHFVTSTSAMARLSHMGFRNIHLVGNPGIDYIRKVDWKKKRPYPEPYVVVSYQAETLNDENEIDRVIREIPDKFAVFIMPNPDRGSEAIRKAIHDHCRLERWRVPGCIYHDSLPHDEFLNLIAHCDEFIGNSSSMLYEAPELGIKTRMIGKRQKGRTIPWGDGNASQRIATILKYAVI